MTTVTALPATVIDTDTAEALPVHENPAVGDTVVTHTRGRYRLARVTKVGPKRVAVEYTTAGAWDTAAKAGSYSRVERIHADNKRAADLAKNYRDTADVIERLNIEPTDDKPLAEKWVPIMSLPLEYRKLERYPYRSNAEIIVYSPKQLREWADDCDARIIAATAALEEAAAYDAKPLADRIAEHVHVTTKSVPRTAILTAPAA
jgi:hypothetical protein